VDRVREGGAFRLEQKDAPLPAALLQQLRDEVARAVATTDVPTSASR
jgi:hypothetical protein